MSFTHPLKQFSLCQRRASGFGYGATSEWKVDPETVKGVIVLAVVKLLPNAATHLESQFRSYRYISGVEQAMNVPPQSVQKR